MQTTPARLLKFILLFLALALAIAACGPELSRAEPLPSASAPPTNAAPPTRAAPVAAERAVHTPAREVTRAATHTPSPTATFEPTGSATPIPDDFYIENIHGHRQYFSIGCEASVAVDWAAYYGVTINEFEFQYRLPVSDNPDIGFVGSVDSPWGQVPPYGYGVHAKPVADLLTAYGLPALGVKGATLDEVKASVAAGNPVITWVIGNVVGGIPYEYTDQQGNKVIVAAYEHVVIVIGYREGMIRYMTNGRKYESPEDNFLNSWGVLGNMALFRGD